MLANDFFGSPRNSYFSELGLPPVFLHFIHTEGEPVAKSGNAQKQC